MPTVAALQKRRSGLVRKHQAQQAVIAKLLDQLVTAYNRASVIEGQIAIVDVSLNDHADKVITKLETDDYAS